MSNTILWLGVGGVAAFFIYEYMKNQEAQNSLALSAALTSTPTTTNSTLANSLISNNMYMITPGIQQNMLQIAEVQSNLPASGLLPFSDWNNIYFAATGFQPTFLSQLQGFGPVDLGEYTNIVNGFITQQKATALAGLGTIGAPRVFNNSTYSPFEVFNALARS